MKATRNYKDSAFTAFFSDEGRLAELYSAVSGHEVPKGAEIDINTLEGVLYRDQINDISFSIAGKQIVLIEAQASKNPNMPLRLLEYVARLFEQIVPRDSVYGTRAITLPRPDFIVLYHGEDEMPDRTALRLSDMFAAVPAIETLELTATVYNVNPGHNGGIMGKSRALYEYAMLVDTVRRYTGEGHGLAEAVRKALKYCIEKDFMREFLTRHGSEVENMLIYEYDRDTDIRINRSEAYEDGERVGKQRADERWQGVIASKDEKWQGVVASKDAKLADKDAEIASLRAMLEKNKQK